LKKIVLLVLSLVLVFFYIFYPIANTLIYNIRLNRLIFVFTVGGGLSISSFILQSITRNQLASEYTLGITSGVAFFASIAYVININPFVVSLISGFLITFFLVFFVRKRLDSNSFIITGIALGIFFGTGISFINYITGFRSSQALSRWIFGSFSVYTYSETIIISLAFIFLLFVFYINLPKIILISVSHIYEEILGVRFKKNIVLIIFAIGVFTSFSSSFVGPIPFYALVIANIVRILFKSDINNTVFYLFFSGFILVFLDFISKNIFFYEEVPIGILTGLICLPLVFISLFKIRY